MKYECRDAQFEQSTNRGCRSNEHDGGLLAVPAEADDGAEYDDDHDDE